MKITAIETFLVQGATAPMCFCAVRTDQGLTGYSEFGNGHLGHGLAGMVRDLSRLMIGKDPRPVERRYMDMLRFTRWAYGGAAQMAIAGIELALWDIKAKALGVPVYELLGGPTRERQQVYWSHLVTYQAGWPDRVGGPRIRTWDDVAACVRMAQEAGYAAAKTNIVFPGEPPRAISQGRGGPLHDQTLPHALLQHAVRQIAVMREAAGDDMELLLDINENFKTEGAIRLGQALEPYRLFWLEIDNLDAAALAQVKASTRTPICSGEQHFGMRQYQPFFEAHAMDYVKVDVQWQGLIPARQVAALAELYELNIAPHNYNGHLSTFQSVNLCACVSNVRICESDPASVPWRDELVTALPQIEDGYVAVPTAPGWGTELDEAALRKYAWEG